MRCASWVVQAKSSTAEILVTTRLYLHSQGVEAFLSPFLSPCLHIVSSFSLAVLFILDLFWFLLWLKPWTFLPIFRKTMRYVKNECISGACHIWKLSLERNNNQTHLDILSHYVSTWKPGWRNWYDDQSTGLPKEKTLFNSRHEQGAFTSSPKRLGQLWCPFGLLFSGLRRQFSLQWNLQEMKLASQFHLLLWLRRCGKLLNCGLYLQSGHGDNFIVCLLFASEFPVSKRKILWSFRKRWH